MKVEKCNYGDYNSTYELSIDNGQQLNVETTKFYSKRFDFFPAGTRISGMTLKKNNGSQADLIMEFCYDNPKEPKKLVFA